MEKPYEPERVGYELGKSKDYMHVTLDGKVEMSAGLEVHHDEHDGYFFIDSFSPSDEKYYGRERLLQLIDQALIELNGDRQIQMKLVVIAHPKTGLNEAFIDGLKVGVFEQLDRENDHYSFASRCPHEKLTGDHYILIGQHLNTLNSNCK